jgi:outer membrane protein OmpA-like peptidoglycan-associated protein
MFAAVMVAVGAGAAAAQDSEATDFLSFSQGAIPIGIGGTEGLRVDMEQALQAIDGNIAGYGATPRPGGADADVWFIYRLPAATTFTSFAVPRVLETPSPSQTFFRDVEIAGSNQGPDGPFELLGSVTLATHSDRDQVTRFAATAEIPVTWVKMTLRGGVNVLTDATFFEFSEIMGEGRQEPVPLLEAFTGKWKGRGVLVELRQDGASVSGCYDGIGDLSGTVSGNLLRATGTDRNTGVLSAFVLTVDGGEITGVRSTNGAPFRLYSGSSDPDLVTECSEQQQVPPPGCGDILHGIQFSYDSAEIRPESALALDALFAGLKDALEAQITIVGHTSSEGAEDYNLDLSERRAASVVAALIERGLEPVRLSALGEGESRPIADNSTEAGRSLNRRVEIACQ